MRKTIKTERELPATGIFRIDRIGDKINPTSNLPYTLDRLDTSTAIKQFEEDEFAFALRMIPVEDLHCDAKGTLVAYKQADFPIDLPFLWWLRGQLCGLYITSDEENPETFRNLSNRMTEDFRLFYSYFPELVDRFRGEVYLYLSNLQLGALQHHAGKINHQAEQLSEFIVRAVVDYTDGNYRELRLRRDLCDRFVEMTNAEQVADDDSEAIISPQNESIKAVVDSILWNYEDEPTVWQYAQWFKEDIEDGKLTNPFVGLVDPDQLYTIKDPFKLFRYIVTDDYWVRQFNYWLLHEVSQGTRIYDN